jgi:hypothetical protein
MNSQPWLSGFPPKRVFGPGSELAMALVYPLVLRGKSLLIGMPNSRLGGLVSETKKSRNCPSTRMGESGAADMQLPDKKRRKNPAWINLFLFRRSVFEHRYRKCVGTRQRVQDLLGGQSAIDRGVRLLHFAGSTGWRVWEALTEKERQKLRPAAILFERITAFRPNLAVMALVLE